MKTNATRINETENVAAEPLRAAIYARYSTDNQETASIDDQRALCLEWAKENGHTVAKEHIYEDPAISGRNPNRPAMNKLLAAAQRKAFDAVLVLNSSRFSRNAAYSLNFMNKLAFYGIELIVVGRGLRTSQPFAKMPLQIESIMNEQYVDFVREETLKSLTGKVRRGYVAGCVGYGYELVPDGETYIDKRGRERSRGSKPKIIEAEAEVIRRIFRDYINGASKGKIVKSLVDDGVPSRYVGKRKGWTESTISRILQNRAFIGEYTWGRTSTKIDPDTGKKIKINNPKDEWVTCHFPEMVIIDKETWDKAQEKWKRLEKSFPKGNKFGRKPKGNRFDEYPTKLLHGMLKCGHCGGALICVGKKENGESYYVCQNNSARHRCKCRGTIARTVIEDLILGALNKEVLQEAAVKRIYEQMSSAIKEQFAELPEEERKLNRSLEQTQARIGRLVDAICDGTTNSSVSQKLTALEEQEKDLKSRLATIKAQKLLIPEPPSQEVIKTKLADLKQLLTKDVASANKILREIFGQIIIERKEDEEGKPYFVVKAEMRASALFIFFASSSNSFTTHWWTCEEHLRTLSELPIKFLFSNTKTFAYQQIGSKALQLFNEGLSYVRVAKVLKVTDKTAKKAILRAMSNSIPRLTKS